MGEYAHGFLLEIAMRLLILIGLCYNLGTNTNYIN